MKLALTSTMIILFLFAALLADSGQAQENTRSAAKWSERPPFSKDAFPIAVWLQDPSNAAKYKAAGINLYVGLWQGPTEAQLAALKAADMPVICEQNATGLAHKNDPIIAGWMHGDEPDNAQEVTDPVTKKRSYGPCIPPARIVSDYARIHAADPTRPVMLNLGQGVANDEWAGRGSGSKLSDYETYIKGGDIVSFDVYPVAGLEKPDSENYLWYVPKGVDRLVKWSAGQNRIWNCVECTQIGGTKKATPKQVRSEVWMALIHGSTGLIYFVHQFQPKFDEHALLDDPEMLSGVTYLNKQIQALAPILNSPTIAQAVTVKSSSEQVPIDLMAKRQGKTLYIFSVGMRNNPAQGTFSLRDVPAKTVEVLGESRSLPVKNGQFIDDFEPYAVHIYRLRQ